MMYRCRSASCNQGFPSEDERDDHELAARHWDDVEPAPKRPWHLSRITTVTELERRHHATADEPCTIPGCEVCP